MMIFVGNLFQLRNIEQPSELVEVEHRLVFAVVAEKRHVLAKIHILKVISNKTAIATLNALAKFEQNFVVCNSFHNQKLNFTTPTQLERQPSCLP